MTPRAKCILILSEKSSGSSALQNLLTRFTELKYLAKTRHDEHETLYWVKAASVLGRPQIDMLDSEVPIAPDRARADLRSLLVDNLDHPNLPDSDALLVFDGWRQLCFSHLPVFVEKSPHHLCQWSALELILEAMERLPDVDFFVIGLIRNPMDTLYSQFRRWGTPPEQLQYQWGVAYRNLLKLENLLTERLLIIRYEDMVSSISHLRPALDFCGAKHCEIEERFLHNRSVGKYRTDKRFGFRLSREIAEVAEAFGYVRSDVFNEPRWLWPVYRRAARLGHKTLQLMSRPTKVPRISL